MSDESIPSYLDPIFKSIRVLIVDDNPVDRKILKAHLEGIGLDYIQEAKDGSEADFKNRNAEKMGTPFDLLITDWRMPQKDGLALIKLLRSERSSTRQYVIMLTSVADKASVEQVLDTGVDDFILKPIDPKILKSKVSALMIKIVSGSAGAA